MLRVATGQITVHNLLANANYGTQGGNGGQGGNSNGNRPGARGGSGGQGGNSGNAGIIVLGPAAAISPLVIPYVFDAPGGSAGGLGGPGGSGNPTGAAGRDGANGRSGAAGTIIIQPISYQSTQPDFIVDVEGDL